MFKSEFFLLINKVGETLYLANSIVYKNIDNLRQ